MDYKIETLQILEPYGIDNLGNKCYLNAIIQTLSNLELFNELEDKLNNKGSDEIIQYLGNYFSSNDLVEFLDFLEDEGL